MMSKKIYGFILLLSVVMVGQAQTLEQLDWGKGIVVLENGKAYAGDISFVGKSDEIFFKNQVMVRQYHAKQLQSFEFYDEDLRLKRYFGTYPAENVQQVKLYEKILYGRYHLLKKIKCHFSQTAKSIHNEYASQGNVYYYWDGQQVVEIKNFKKQFKEIFKKHGYDLMLTIQQKAYNLNKFQDQIKIVNGLNKSIKQEKYAQRTE
jgi:hypothetical protein